MKIAAGSLEYAHARIRARWGGRPDEALWQRLEGTRELGAMLELARASALAPWLEGVALDGGLHGMERALRRHWRARVAELAAWMPPPWQAALAWCAPLVDLPLVQALARGQPAPAWAGEDDALRPLLDKATTPAHRAWAGAAGGSSASDAADAARDADALRGLLAAARACPERTLGFWRERWLQRLPPGAAGRSVAATLLPLLQQHALALGAPGVVDGWAPRRALHAALALRLRRHGSEPLTAFVYLALVALELERLRGEIVRRAAFPRRWAVA